MLFNYRYAGSSAVSSSANRTQMSFAPDTLRDPTYFIGKLGKHIPFREAISALHDVVISDLRFKPKDREAYKAWAQTQEDLWLAEAMGNQEQVKQQIEKVRAELNTLYNQSSSIMGPYHKAKQKYFNYLYERDYDAWFVLDPVITVHPDEIFFECFSQDESSYGRLGANYEVFKEINEFECGTTNIDYSDPLYQEFQKIRDYKETEFKVEPGGFDIQTTGEEAYTEVKIDLPDSWVRGFLQVSSAMTLPARRLELHPMDIHNLCFVLRRHKEKLGPRSMRYILEPGAPVRVIFEPWNFEVICPRSRYLGHEKDEIRVWGRRRLLILERLIPVAKKFTVYLLGSGLPSFYVADLGDMNFTLGLSGWTKNDWSRMGNFDLMAPRQEVDNVTKLRVFESLKENWVEDIDSLSRRLNMDRAMVLGALSAWTQAGRVIYDLNREVFRVRELSREPLPMEQLRFANEREQEATSLVNRNKVQVVASPTQKGLKLSGTVQGEYQTYHPELIIDQDQRLVEATCSCSFYNWNKLFKGPCEHMLATRIAYNRSR